MSGAVPAGDPSRSSPQKDTAGGQVLSHVLILFPPHLSISTLTGGRRWGFAGIFQELSVPAAVAATSKMEAACAAIKREPSELFPFRLQSYARWPTGFRACHMPLPTWQPGPAVPAAERDAGSDGFHTLPLPFCRRNRWLLGQGAWILTLPQPHVCRTSGRRPHPDSLFRGSRRVCVWGGGNC